MSNPSNTFNILPATSDCSLSNTSRTFAPTSTIDLTPPPTADGNRDSRKSFNASVVDEIPEEEERGRHGAMSDRMTRTISHSSIDSDSSDRHLLQTEIDDGKAKRTKIRKFGSIVLYTVYFAVCLAIGAGILISQVMISQIPSQSLFPISHFPFPRFSMSSLAAGKQDSVSSDSVLFCALTHAFQNPDRPESQFAASSIVREANR
jgi:hypothetical protein